MHFKIPYAEHLLSEAVNWLVSLDEWVNVVEKTEYWKGYLHF